MLTYCSRRPEVSKGRFLGLQQARFLVFSFKSIFTSREMQERTAFEFKKRFMGASSSHNMSPAAKVQPKEKATASLIFLHGLGRNVALKGETNSSWSISKDDHKLAVDGNTDGQFTRGGSCTHSNDEDKTPSWTLTLKENYLVDRIDLYNRGDCCKDRLRNFSLTATDNTGSHSFIYTGPDSVQSKYSVLPMKHLEISFLKIQATYIEKKMSILTLCEVEVYGDCLPTKWGLDCANDCSSKCPKACHIEDGTCDTSCVGYFDPPSCAKKCTPGNWGINCSNDCGNKCYRTCNVFSGYCDEGCLGFQNPPFCTEDNCRQSRCRPDTGECLKCKDGYTGKFCHEACTTGRWGDNCSKDCDVKCYDTCHREKGGCHLGCQGYSDPPWCSKACRSGLYGKNCTSVCSANCVDSKCNATTGECFSCVSGHFGIMCEFDQSSSENDKQNSTLIYVTVAAIFTVILIVIAVIILIRRRFQVTNHSKSEDLQWMSVLKSKDRDFESDNKLNSDLEATYQNTSGHSQEDTSVPVQDLFTYITSHDSDFYKSQFQSVPLAKGVSTNVAQSEENRSKNRYKNICPYDHNRVHLDKNSTKSHSDYINASHINGYNNVESFIASQGPHKAILNDFIRMLWEQCIEKIAMLTSLAEDGKMKCEQYWPDEGKIQFGDIKVKLLSTENFADYSVRILELSQKGGKRHTVTQFHYLAWPDKGVPSNPWSFAEFQHRVSSEPTPKPLLVHCSAGAGRTGSYIALHHILKQAEMTGKVNFYQTLVKLRQDRMCMIQTAAQYEFVHIAALVSMTCSGSFRKPDEFNDMFKLMMANTGLSNEYTKLCKICKYLHGLDTSSQPVQDAEVYQNMEKSSGDSKNRFSSILPKEAHRPLLTKESNEMGDYVNAIFISGLKRKSQFILTQLPMPTTVLDFWRLVTQYNVCLIVAFEMDEKETDSSYGQYLPTDHQMKLSMLEIETTDLNRSSLTKSFDEINSLKNFRI
ncbi:hypothetical protein Btru_034220 [Bulinus truncatus]|nr:hypothetical protein Btru_034220 [Bulinus truncatus]